MRNLIIALTLSLSSLVIPAFTLAACSSADVKAPMFSTIKIPAVQTPEIKSVATRQDADLGTVTVTVYKSTVVDL